MHIQPVAQRRSKRPRASSKLEIRGPVKIIQNDDYAPRRRLPRRQACIHTRRYTRARV